MLFLVRSAFWLGMVYSAMPFDNSEQTRELARLRAALSATCPAERASSCLALKLGLSEAPLAADATIVPLERQSANSLTKADASPPWRGKPRTIPRAGLARRAAMPI